MNGSVEIIGTGIPRAPLGSSGVEISKVGLGAWAIGGPGWLFGLGPQADGDSVETIVRAVEAGCNWIDTAPAYGLGHSEEVIARALRTLPEHERPYVFTKCAISWDENWTQSRVWAPEALRRDAEDSLRRLGVERIDLLQIHWPGEDAATVEEAWGAMSGLVEQGKVRWIGVSNFDTDLLDRCETIHHVDTIQPALSLIAREAASDVIPWALAHRTGVLIYSPLQTGLLSGTFSRERLEQLDEADGRRRMPGFMEPELSRNLELANRLAQLAQRVGCTLAELAIAWTLAVPGVSGAIVGARRPDQLGGCIGGAALELPETVLDEIAAIIVETGAGRGPTRVRSG